MYESTVSIWEQALNFDPGQEYAFIVWNPDRKDAIKVLRNLGVVSSVQSVPHDGRQVVVVKPDWMPSAEQSKESLKESLVLALQNLDRKVKQ